MDQVLKHRLVGAVVLVSVGVLFLPVLFEGVPTPEEPRIETTNIPPKPETGFNSRIIPLESDAEVTVPPPTPASPAPTPAAATAPAAPSTADKPATAPKPAARETVAAGADMSKPAATGTSAVKQKLEQLSSDKNKPSQKPAEKSPPPAAPAVAAKSETMEKSEQRIGVTAWAVQLGSFGSEQNAKELEARLQKQGYAAFVEKLYASDGPKYRVRIGPELVRTKAQEVRDKVEKDMNLKGIVVRYP